MHHCRTSTKTDISIMANAGVENKDQMKLYSYWRSSCAHRVRIALSLKGLEYEYIAVNLLNGDHLNPGAYICSKVFEKCEHCVNTRLDGAYIVTSMKINPMGTIPVLVDGDVVISDSFAIILYLDEKYPEPPLLPRDLLKRAVNYEATTTVSSGIQPQQNLALFRYLEKKITAEEKSAWISNAIKKGFTALEKLLASHVGKYATGDEVSLADLFLAPQIHGAINRFQIDVEPYPTLVKCYEAYNNLSAFQDAAPEKQPDAPIPTS